MDLVTDISVLADMVHFILMVHFNTVLIYTTCLYNVEWLIVKNQKQRFFISFSEGEV